jgi:hypothetical protein
MVRFDTCYHPLVLSLSRQPIEKPTIHRGDPDAEARRFSTDLPKRRSHMLFGQEDFKHIARRGFEHFEDRIDTEDQVVLFCHRLFAIQGFYKESRTS